MFSAVWQVGIDTGGTFTDVVAVHDAGKRGSVKVPSTPPSFEDGIVEGLEKLGIHPDEIGVIYHGTTITTNAVITKTGANTALVTTRGFRDVLEIRRGNREDMYDILWDPPPPLVPRYNRLEVGERTDYRGEIIRGVDASEVRDIARILRKRGIQAVAISLLHSYMNPHNEETVRDLLEQELPDVYVTLSAEVDPQPFEFERTATAVANAYLGPVLSNYLRRLEKRLHDKGYSADVLLIHSAGGVMTLQSAAGLAAKTAGSGPAAGVIGAAAIGTATGRRDLISLDMGGTSCDISVILDGRPRLKMQHQLEWGVPVRFPSIDFAAIGAGGGSIAWIDAAGYPRVGPESAGANPGPACYGLGGGRPTTTDANLVLGRLNPETFLGGELKIDPAIAHRAISSQLAEPLGLSAEAAAAGVVRIANANMASAVRLVTVQKGFDPRDFTLVAFGGAGPLHAVEVARELGIREVVVPPEPGLTSALGLLFADVVHDLSQSFVMSDSHDRDGEADTILAGFEQELRDRLSREGADPADVKIAKFVDIRYVGQIHTITVPIEGSMRDETTLPAAIEFFHRAHEREYRYARREWPVEVCVLRVEARAEMPKPRFQVQLPLPQDAPVINEVTRAVFFDGEGWLQTRIVDRSQLRPGASVRGPAVIEEFDSTTLLSPDVSGEVDDFGNLVIELSYAHAGSGGRQPSSRSATKQVPEMSAVDPVTFEVLRNAFMAAVDEMGTMLEKVAFSLIVSQGRDFSTSISNAAGDLVADGTQDLPGHVGTLPFTTKAILRTMGEGRLQEGDIVLMNDPFIGGTHCQDARTVMPIFWDNELVAFAQVSAHWSDMGGSVPGSFKVDARSTYEEALHITPIHLVRQGEMDEDVLNLVLRNIRVPQVTIGDIVAMIEACRTGQARVHTLLRKYGKPLILEEMRELVRHSERLLRRHLAELPDGTYSFTDYIDYDPGSTSREPLPIHLDLSIEKDRAIYDFSKSAPQALGAINAPRSLLWSAVVVATKAIFTDVPVNQGIFNAIDVVAPDGLVVTAQFPRPTSGAFSSCYEKITATVLGCYLQILPERSMVGSGNISNLIIGGFDPRPGYDTEYVMYNWSEGGYGARPGKKDNHSAISLFASGTYNQPMEMMERFYPVLFEGYGLMEDSAGPGRHRGGLGIFRNFRLTHGTGTLSCSGDRELRPAWGAAGGRAANRGNQILYKADTPDEVVIGMKRSGVEVESGWLIRYWEGGGGGYGPPWERPVEWVLEDVVHGYVSVEKARADYFVVIRVRDEEGLEYEVDAEASAELRKRAEEEHGRGTPVVSGDTGGVIAG